MAKKIIICTTFRDFNGNANDKIQRLFLESLKAQTYQEYLLVVTIFREKNVPEAVNASGVKNLLCYGDAGAARFSMTQVINNAIEAARKEPDSIVVWATCDTLLDPKFFQYLADLEDKSICGTSYPHIGYQTVEDFHNKANRKYIWLGIDMIFFSSSVLLDDKLEEAIKKYPNNDWGFFEFLLLAWGLVFAKKTINTWPMAVTRIDNDYKAAGQRYEDAKISCNNNLIELKGFTKEFGLDNDYFRWILRYKMPGAPWTSVFMRVQAYFRISYASSYIRRAMPKLKRMLGLKK